MTRSVLWKKLLAACAAGLLAAMAAGCNLSGAALIATDLPAATRTATASPTPFATDAALPPTATRTITATPRPSIQRVLIVSVDGLRAGALSQARIPNLAAFALAGASTLAAQTVMPSVTLPAHTSMLSGRCVSNHGVDWNDDRADVYVEGATVFSIAHDAGLRTVMVVGKRKLETIARPGTVDDFKFIAGSDEEIAQAAVGKMPGGFGVMFVHLPVVDGMGHEYGWESPQYFSVIHRADTAIGILMEGLRAAGFDSTTLVIITADHGGHGTGHGTTLPADITIPWLAAGPAIPGNLELTVPVSVVDTASTAIWALGWNLPAEWDGRPVVEAFGMTAAEAGVPEAALGRCGAPEA